MTAQLWKRAGEMTARVTFRCPWCDVIGTATVSGCHLAPATAWLLVGCPEPTCRRGVLITFGSTNSWIDLDTGESGRLLDDRSIVPPYPTGRVDRAQPVSRAELDLLLVRAEGMLRQLRAAVVRLADHRHAEAEPER